MFVHDHSRLERIGQSEAVFCDGKATEVLQEIFGRLVVSDKQPILFTRLSERQYSELINKPDDFDYDPLSKTAFLHGCHENQNGTVAVISAGSSDLSVSREVSRTLDFFGIQSNCFEDIGVAGLWRLQEQLPEINKHDLIIVVAGLDAAIVSVLGGLVSMPVIAVPTSIGYGMAKGGETALQSALCSCAQGIVIVNIDNGFGAASAAGRILTLANRRQSVPV